MTRVLAAIAVAALVVLAGCGGAPATEAPGTTTDAADGTTTEEEAFVSVPSDLVPPGANSQGITNPGRMADAHVQALSNASYQSNASYNRLYLGQQYDTEGTVTYNVTHTPTAYTSSRTTVENGSTESQDVYLGEDAVFIRNKNASKTTYQYGAGPVPLRLSNRRGYAEPAANAPRVLFVYLNLAANVQPTGFSTMNGEKVVKYEATGMKTSNLSKSRFGAVIGAPKGTLEDISFTMYVDGDGVVHRASGSMELERENGESRSRSLSYRLEMTDAPSPTEPSWTSDVPRLNGTLDRSNTLLSVTNEGNVTISDYSVSVIGNASGDTSVNASLAPGETAYVYVTGSGNETEVTVSKTRPTVPDDARALPRNGRAFVTLDSSTYMLNLGVFKNTSSGSSNATVPRSIDGPSRTVAVTSSTATVEALATLRDSPARSVRSGVVF